MFLFACDLDNTLIHSYKKMQENDICVEHKGEKELSFMTPKAIEMLRELNSRVCFVPVTTRSSEQYERIHLFKDIVPKYAISANGGILYVDGKRDDAWFEHSKGISADCENQLKLGHEILRNDKNLTLDIHTVDELFLFTKSAQPQNTMQNLLKKLNSDLVSVYTIGEKVYIFPTILSKRLAVERLADKFDFEKIICAGDSEFDIPMLEISDIAFKPQSLEFRKNAQVYSCENGNFAEFFLEKMLSYV